MRLLIAATLLILLSNTSGAHAQKCGFGGGENFANTVHLLETAPSCKQANTILHNCAWGSSADTQFAPIAVTKCEKDFLAKLPKPAEDRYIEEMQLCAYGESRAEGTMSMSEAAICQADVAYDFATHPDKAYDRPLRASFNCKLAKSPLEQTICAHISIGHADIILSRDYNGFLRSLPASKRPLLVRDEQTWLENLPRKCGLTSTPASPHEVDCLKNEFEIRFTLMDGCAGPAEDCLNDILHPHDLMDTIAPSSGQRASFDCEKPSDGVELAVCADADLGQLDLQLEDTYRNASKLLPSSDDKPLRASQQKWRQFVAHTCPLGVVGGIPDILTRGCLRELYEKRIAQVQRCPRQSLSAAISCLGRFEGLDPPPSTR
jgi:uncharacterized protein